MVTTPLKMHWPWLRMYSWGKKKKEANLASTEHSGDPSPAPPHPWDTSASPPTPPRPSLPARGAPCPVPNLVEHLEELGAGLVDGADDGAAALRQGAHQGHHLEAGGAVQAAAATEGEEEEKKKEQREKGRGERGKRSPQKHPPIAGTLFFQAHGGGHPVAAPLGVPACPPGGPTWWARRRTSPGGCSPAPGRWPGACAAPPRVSWCGCRSTPAAPAPSGSR